MKKHTLLFALFFNVLVFSQTFSDNNINYNITSSTSPYRVEVIDSPNATGAITIPETVTYNTIEYAVTSVGTEAFSRNALTSVNIGNNVTNLGFDAFAYNNLTSVTIGDNVAVIQQGAFFTNALTTVTIPDSVTSIATYAFANNTTLTSVFIGATTPPNINTDVFSTVTFNNAILVVPQDLVAEYEAAAVWKDFEILSETFTQGDYLYTITSQNTVDVSGYIGTNTEITIADTVISNEVDYKVTRVGNVAFLNRNLTEITIGNNITLIDGYAFNNNDLTKLIIPDSVVSIEYGAFGGNNITELIFGSGITFIGEYAFTNNNNLSFVSISATTPPIINSTVFETDILGNVLLSIPNNDYASASVWQDFNIEFGAFKEGDFVYSTVANNTLSVVGYTGLGGDLEIPSGFTIGDTQYSVEVIAANTFKNKQLTKVTIPSTITSIGDYAFAENPSLVKVNSKIDGSISLPYLLDNVFTNKSNIDLSIPEGQGISVLYSFSGWTGFKSVRQDTDLSIHDITLSKEIDIVFANNTVTITTPKDIAFKNVVIYNITGEEVLRGNEHTILTTTLTTGVYVLKIATDKGTVTKKIIK